MDRARQIPTAHPVANLFPMLADDEMTDLAADIAERGLLHPVVLDSQGRVLDGRNRLRACEMAGVEPRFVTYDGADPAGYALSVNIARRHLSKGQRAMIAAKARLLETNNRPTQQQVADQTGANRSAIAQAETVLNHAPDLADAVIAGGSLDQAYTVAQERKRQQEEEQRGLAWLRAHHPRFAEAIDRGEHTVVAAMAAAHAAEVVEDRAALDAKKRAGLQQAVKLARERIGAEVPLPREAVDRARSMARAQQVIGTNVLQAAMEARTLPRSTATLAAQKKLFNQLRAVQQILTKLKKQRPSVASGPDGDEMRATVRAATSQIIAAALALQYAVDNTAHPRESDAEAQDGR